MLDDIFDELQDAGRRGDVPRAIQLCRRGLELTSPDQLDDWFPLALALATALVNTEEDPVDSREEAIAMGRAILETLDENECPKKRADTHRVLAVAYRERLRGDPGANLEHAIAHTRAVLAFYTRDRSPSEWAVTRSYLGFLYSERVEGDRSENLVAAIACYRDAEAVYVDEDDPEMLQETRGILRWLVEKLDAEWVGGDSAAPQG